MNDDLISRQAVLDIINNPLNIRLDEIIKKLPPVTLQEPKTGHWIDMDEGFSPCECSECASVEFVKSNYCPNCGVRMESEDKE